VHLSDVAAYAQVTTHWLPWLRTVVGLREDRIQGSDSGTNPGEASASLFQPKASLIVTPLATTELYLSAGRGFHSDDLRGVNQAALTGVAGAPLIARQDGAEIGIRQQVGRRLAITLALFSLDAQSETTYDPDAGQDSAGPASRRRGFRAQCHLPGRGVARALRQLFGGSFALQDAVRRWHGARGRVPAECTVCDRIVRRLRQRPRCVERWFAIPVPRRLSLSSTAPFAGPATANGMAIFATPSRVAGTSHSASTTS